MFERCLVALEVGVRGVRGKSLGLELVPGKRPGLQLEHKGLMELSDIETVLHGLQTHP